jgi:putative alpha-1,2-mannosidase
MRGRTKDGSWVTPFDPFEPYYNYMFKEATGWQTLWLVPHDVQGLINLLGGREKFAQRLDTFFTTPYQPKGVARDVTGMIGLYCQGNQPDQQAPYLYAYAGQPWKTQKLVRDILRLMYGSDKYGLAFPGMDDQGSVASWYVLSALGFYTGGPGQSELRLSAARCSTRLQLTTGQRQETRHSREGQFRHERLHPVRHVERQTVEQTVVQPRRHRGGRNVPSSRWARSPIRRGAVRTEGRAAVADAVKIIAGWLRRKNSVRAFGEQDSRSARRWN